jgi:hypothetical protein
MNLVADERKSFSTGMTKEGYVSLENVMDGLRLDETLAIRTLGYEFDRRLVVSQRQTRFAHDGNRWNERPN